MKGIHTPFCSALGVEAPLVQAPIGSAATPELAASVSNAGALGSLAVTWRSLEGTRQTIEKTSQLTDEPFLVNLVLDPATKPHDTRDHLEVCLDAGAPVVSLSFGDPAPYMDMIHDEDALAVATVASAEEALQAEEAGVDILVCQGWEAGGHVQSEVASMPLIPRVADSVDVPVVAAGGISCGRGVAAALVLGAAGAWLGTRFVASRESGASRRYRERVVEADETSTYYGEVFTEGWRDMPHRVLRNEAVKMWLEDGCPAGGERPGEGDEVARYPGGRSVERYGFDLPVEGMTGEEELMALYAGQSAGGVGEVKGAGEVVEELVRETREAVDRLDGLTG